MVRYGFGTEYQSLLTILYAWREAVVQSITEKQDQRDLEKAESFRYASLLVFGFINWVEYGVELRKIATFFRFCERCVKRRYLNQWKTVEQHGTAEEVKLKGLYYQGWLLRVLTAWKYKHRQVCVTFPKVNIQKIRMKFMFQHWLTCGRQLALQLDLEKQWQQRRLIYTLIDWRALYTRRKRISRGLDLLNTAWRRSKCRQCLHMWPGRLAWEAAEGMRLGRIKHQRGKNLMKTLQEEKVHQQHVAEIVKEKFDTLMHNTANSSIAPMRGKGNNQGVKTLSFKDVEAELVPELILKADRSGESCPHIPEAISSEESMHNIHPTGHTVVNSTKIVDVRASKVSAVDSDTHNSSGVAKKSVCDGEGKDVGASRQVALLDTSRSVHTRIAMSPSSIAMTPTISSPNAHKERSSHTGAATAGDAKHNKPEQGKSRMVAVDTTRSLQTQHVNLVSKSGKLKKTRAMLSTHPAHPQNAHKNIKHDAVKHTQKTPTAVVEKTQYSKSLKIRGTLTSQDFAPATGIEVMKNCAKEYVTETPYVPLLQRILAAGFLGIFLTQDKGMAVDQTGSRLVLQGAVVKYGAYSRYPYAAVCACPVLGPCDNVTSDGLCIPP